MFPLASGVVDAIWDFRLEGIDVLVDAGKVRGCGFRCAAGGTVVGGVVTAGAGVVST